MQQEGKRCNLIEIRWVIDGVRFCDGDGNVVGSLREEIQNRICNASGGERIHVNIEFPETIFMEGFDVETPPYFPKRIKILRLSVTVDIMETTSIRPFTSEQYTTYEMKRVLEEDGQYVLLTADESEPKAVVALLVGKASR